MCFRCNRSKGTAVDSRNRLADCLCCQTPLARGTHACHQSEQENKRQGQNSVVISLKILTVKHARHQYASCCIPRFCFYVYAIANECSSVTFYGQLTQLSNEPSLFFFFCILLSYKSLVLFHHSDLNTAWFCNLIKCDVVMYLFSLFLYHYANNQLASSLFFSLISYQLYVKTRHERAGVPRLLLNLIQSY